MSVLTSDVTLLAAQEGGHGAGAGWVAGHAAEGTLGLTWLLVALPLLGAAVLLLGGRRTNGWGHWLGTAMSAASFVVAVLLFLEMLGRDGDDRAFRQELWSWVPVDQLDVDVALRLDPLSMVFVLLVTLVGTLVHVYSVGYMAHDPGRRRFFAYLNLFVAAMLLLVLADNFLLLYVGWEGVGLASYLLIGFWNYHPDYAAAARKAFIVNRVGDFGLALAIFLMFWNVGAVDFDSVFGSVSEGAGAVGEGTLTAIALLLLLAATGKSAQLPLQSWLLDAMAGPTPVSALIHAATMVTAGVYLIVRSHAIFDAAPTAQLAVLVVGALTLLYGAIIGCAKDDIKKALAASTMSQIGYMFLAAGFGPAGYVFAIAHLLAHGFFKAGLFLGAGSVMHAMNDSVDMRRYGGLARVLPVTFVTFLLGYLAIIGLFPFAGFWTKDAIIETAIGEGGWRAWVFGGAALLGAGLTAFYMTRVVVMTFFGKRRWAEGVHPHEAPASMTGPMVLLAIGSVFSGGYFVLGGRLEEFLGLVVPVEHHELPVPLWVISLGTLAVVLTGATIAWLQYGRRDIPVTAPTAVSPVTVAARNNLYQDHVNEAVFMRPGTYLTRSLVYADNRGVDGAVNGTAALIGGTSGRLRRWQTGFVRTYALSMLGGAVVVTGALLLVRV